MKHVIRVDIEVDEDPVDEGEGVQYPYSHAVYQPLRDKYRAILEGHGLTVDNPESIRVFPIRVGRVQDGEFVCPNDHDNIEYFEDVYSTRDVNGVKDNVLYIDGGSTEHDGQSDVLEFACKTCGVLFTLPAELEVEYT